MVMVMVAQIVRLLAHRWRQATLPRDGLSSKALARLGEWVRCSELRHSGEILVYAEPGLPLSDQWRDELLDLVARVPAEVWQAMVTRMATAFKQGAFEAGLAGAIDEVTALLSQHFALAPGVANPNELPDQPVLG